MRQRACGAVLWEDQILMVRHIHDGEDYWTLPGGGIEPDECPEKAAEREVLEETGLAVSCKQYLFTTQTDLSVTQCYLMSVPPNPHDVALGIDPEQLHLTPSQRMLQEARWHTLESVREDFQVALVIKALENGVGID